MNENGECKICGGEAEVVVPCPECAGQLGGLTALLEECLTNGDAGKQELYAWFLGERWRIQDNVIKSKAEGL